MRKKIIDRTYIRYLSMLCVIVYFTSYITRNNFATVVLEIVNAEGFLKSEISIVVIGSISSYAMGQLVIGFLSQKIEPKWLIFSGILFTSILNLVIPLCNTITSMALVWFVNGFAQSMLWAPMIKILTEYLENKAFRDTIAKVSIASLLSTIAMHLIFPICIFYADWKMIFYLSGILGFIATFIWYFGFDKVDEHRNKYGYINKETTEPRGIFEKAHQKNPLLSVGMLYIIIGVIMRGVLKDGISMWIPSFIFESYEIPSYFSILLSVILPIFGILSVKIAMLVYNKVNKDEILGSAIFFALAFFAAIVMRITYTFGAVLALVLAAIITSSTYGVGLMLGSILPSRFEKYGRVASVAGIINFFIYVGSAISTYGTAKLTELYGWNFTILSWAFFALIGFIACFMKLKRSGNDF